MRKVNITINNIDFTKYLIYPIKWANLLDERLDEAYITLKFVPKTLQALPFYPLQKVQLQFISDTEQVTRTYIVAQDNANENPNGEDFLTHNLYIIEETKELEGFLCDSLTFRNALVNRYGKKYTINAVDEYTGDPTSYISKLSDYGGTPVSFQNPLDSDTLLTIPSINTAASNIKSFLENQYTNVRLVSVLGAAKTQLEIKNGTVSDIITDFNDAKQLYPAPYLYLRYSIVFQYTVVTTDPDEVRSFEFHYNLNGFKGRLPLKKWTITDCINRCVELAEPLQKGENPRYALDGVTYTNGATGTLTGQAAELEKILAPEFSMTKATLREQLKQIGGFIHAEPRLKDGVITFDKFGGTTLSNISKKAYIGKSENVNINEFCTDLDSTANNLVNRLSYAQGVTYQPNSKGGETLRTEAATIRIQEDNAFARTYLPIDNVFKVECSAPLAAGDNPTFSDFVDITQYVFTETDYNNLSSYEFSSNGNKAYALYYTRGARNIKGLFFKNADVISPIFQKYAIINILAACGINVNTSGNYPYPIIQFRITYTPVYTARVKTNKSIVLNTMPRTLAYNQGANGVETQYYGENLKGVAARLGNIEKTYTYKLGRLNDIPKAGELFDAHYYISAVASELYADYIKCTIALSKDFNRLSEYVGISSELRQYQVSETAIYNRESIIQEYALITSDTTKKSDRGTLIKYDAISAINEVFNPGTTLKKKMSAAVVETYQKDDTTRLSKLLLPLTASAFGNNMSFRFEFEDNYSAGQKATKVNNTYYADYVPYTDYYGRFYYLRFALQNDDDLTAHGLTQALKYPENTDTSTVALTGDISTTKSIRYRKDNAEIPAVNYELSFVTDDESYIIGSGLADECPLVKDLSITGALKKPKLYGFYKRLPLFDKQIDLDSSEWLGQYKDLEYLASNVKTEKVTIGGVQFTVYYIELNATAISVTAPIMSWAIITPPDYKTTQVSDEDGNSTTQATQNGFKILIGRNYESLSSDPITLPRIIFKRKIYKE